MGNNINLNGKNTAFKRPMFKQELSEGYSNIPEKYAILFITMTTVILAYSSLFGIYPILIFYALWFQYIKYKNKLTLKPSKDIIGIIILAGIAVISTLWSDDRMGSLKGSLEFASMLGCTIITARIVSVNALIKGLLIGTFIVLLVTFRGGVYSIDGLFGSKNQVGSYAEIGATLTLILSLVDKKSFIKLSVLATCMIFFLLCLYLSHSATSVTSLIATIIIFAMALYVGVMPIKIRGTVFLCSFIFCILSIILCYYLGLIDTGLNLLGKDKTLTGRTYLWSEGIKYGLDRLWTGYGYNAFWIKGRPEAEKLWFEFDMFNRSGFHFHNLFVNVFVELGLFGLLVFATIYLSTVVYSIKYLLRVGTSLESIFFISMTTTFLVRSISEVDTTGPFGIGPLIFYSIIPRIVMLNSVNNKSESSNTSLTLISQKQTKSSIGS